MHLSEPVSNYAMYSYDSYVRNTADGSGGLSIAEYDIPYYFSSGYQSDRVLGPAGGKGGRQVLNIGNYQPPVIRKSYKGTRYIGHFYLDNARIGRSPQSGCIAFQYFLNVDYLILIHQDRPLFLSLDSGAAEEQKAVFPPDQEITDPMHRFGLAVEVDGPPDGRPIGHPHLHVSINGGYLQ
jgi:hypothetical protein